MLKIVADVLFAALAGVILLWTIGVISEIKDCITDIKQLIKELYQIEDEDE